MKNNSWNRITVQMILYHNIRTISDSDMLKPNYDVSAMQRQAISAILREDVDNLSCDNDNDDNNNNDGNNKSDHDNCDFVNNKKQRSNARRGDQICLDVMHAINLSLTELVEFIKESKIVCWNQHIIKSGLTKEYIVSLLSQKYDKSCRSEDMQRIVSLYPYNLRLTDMGIF